MYVVVVVLDFVKIRPREELLHSKCSPRRGGLGRSTPRVCGGFLMAVFGLYRKGIKKYRASIEQVVQRSKT